MKLIAEKINGILANVKYYNDQITALLEVSELLTNVDLSDCESMDAGKYGKQLVINLYLKNECQDSNLVHQLSQKLCINFGKRLNWSEESLIAEYGSSELFIRVNNYVPATCQIVIEETPLTAEEIELARSEVKTVRQTKRVVCS